MRYSNCLISRWEQGFSLPDLQNAFKLAVVYGVIVDALFMDLRQSVQALGTANECARVNRYENTQTTTLQGHPT